MGLFDFMRKGKEEPAKPQQPARPQQTAQQKSGSMIDLNNKQQDRPPVLNQTSAISPEFYEIKKGDTLSAIAKQQLGDASKWRTIYEANKDVIKNPDLIYPGQKIKIPK